LPQPSVEWRRSPELIAYPDALATMEQRVELVHAGRAPELVWLLEHPPLYTAGTSAAPDEYLGLPELPVYRSGRGGRFTYHGPGQRVAYVVLDLRRRKADLRDFVWRLEEWAIRSLARLGVGAGRRPGRIGIWVSTSPVGEAKIGAIGVRVRRWVSYHGIAVNVSPDLSHYAGIVPCGIREFGVTSLAALGSPATMADLDEALRAEFEGVLGAGRPAMAEAS
jgi:lipoyl(octanoyl) transferase